MEPGSGVTGGLRPWGWLTSEGPHSSGGPYMDWHVKAFKSRTRSWGLQVEGPNKDLILKRPRRPQDIAKGTLTVDSP